MRMQNEERYLQAMQDHKDDFERSVRQHAAECEQLMDDHRRQVLQIEDRNRYVDGFCRRLVSSVSYAYSPIERDPLASRHWLSGHRGSTSQGCEVWSDALPTEP